MLRKAAMVSGQFRVLRPQSGLAQRRSTATASAARSNSASISSTDGTRGLWMSYSPGPISLGYWKSAKAVKSSMRLRLASMLMTSASMAAMAGTMALNSA